MIDLASASRAAGDVDPKKLLETFAQYGFRKTSMQDIGRAAGVSRQSIYNKFGSKDGAFTWSIHSYLADMYGRIFAALGSDVRPPVPTLQLVFDAFMGEAVDIVGHPHGTEVFDAALEATHQSGEDWPLRFRTRLGHYLHRCGYAPSKEDGLEKAYLLISASKGISLEVASKEEFRSNMTRIIEAVLGTPVGRS